MLGSQEDAGTSCCQGDLRRERSVLLVRLA